MIKSPDYVYEKMHVAIDCLCGSGSFTKRLEDATISALIRLKDDDVGGELSEDFRFILDQTTRNMEGGKLKRKLSARKQQEIREKMLRILAEALEQSVLARSF